MGELKMSGGDGMGRGEAGDRRGKKMSRLRELNKEKTNAGAWAQSHLPF
jgi:hypothetical protein